MTKQENMNRENMIKKEIKESREFDDKYNLSNIDYIIVSEENFNTPYKKGSNEKPIIRWGGNMYLGVGTITNENLKRLPSVVAEVREKINELGFVLEGDEGNPYVDENGEPFVFNMLDERPQLPQVKEMV